MHKLDQIVCFLCGLVFTSNSKYDYHMSTHDVAKQKKCQYCDRLFLSEAKMKIHERIHTGERPYLCTVCGQGMYRKKKVLIYSAKCNMFPRQMNLNSKFYIIFNILT